MKAVVMAGGEGTRLRPLTCNRPKPLVPVCNKPVMEYIIELLKSHGIDQIVVTLHYLANEVVSYFGDGSDWGVQMIYSVEDEPLGTAGSVKKVEQYLNDTFLIISGDALTDFDLTRAIEFHKERGSVATITLTRVDNPLEYGVVITDDDGRIRRFLEKPSWGEVFSDTINTGIYVLEPEIFAYMEPERSYDFSKDLFPKLLAEGEPLFGFVTGGYWCDIGNLQQYRQAHMDMFSGRVKAEIPGEQVAKDVWIGEGTEVHPGAQIEAPIVIGRHCRIKEGAYVGDFTTVGDNCIVEDGATLHRSVVWNNVYVGKKSRVTGATICRQSTIKANATISDGVILGDKCFVGQGAVIHPQVKIWPDKNVEAGATVSMSLIWGIKWPGSLFGVNGISGLANIEITPEFALKLGAAYGAFLEKGATVCTSRDPHPAARMLNRSIICGLTSVGVNVYDLRAMPTPVSRYAIRNLGSKGGVHVRISPEDPRLLLIEFYDSRGINIDKSVERKIENNFFREDFRRTPMDEVGVIDFPARVVDQYMEGFYEALHGDFSGAGYKVVIDYCYGNASLVLPLLLGKLGCETVALNAYLDAIKGRAAMEERDKAPTQLANIVTTLGADLGILISQDAETIVLIDEKGNIISGDRLLALMALLGLRSVKNGIVAVPVTAPSVIDRIAHEFQGKVIRTKTDGRSLMHTAQLGEKKILFAGQSTGAFIFPSFHPAFDGMFAFAKLLGMMGRQKAKLSELVAMIPPFYVARTTVDCAWQRKGRVMRRMIEDNRDRPVEMIDGIKAYFDGGWVLLNPDPSEPHLHLWVEGQSPEQTNQLLEEYTQKLVQMVNGEVPDGAVPEKEKAPRKERKPRKPRATFEAEATTVADLETIPFERAFHFWAPGRYLGIKAQSFREFVNTLHFIDSESLEYHLDRGDFSNWVEYELHNAGLANKIRKLHEVHLRGEQLRNELLKVVR